MSKIKKNPTKVAAKWQKRISGAVEEVKEGVNAVTEAPTKAAVQKQAKLVAGFQQAIENGKWKRNTERVTLDEWKKAMLDKGVNRIATGAANATSKVEQFHQELSDFQAALQSRINQIDDTTPEGREQRLLEWTRGMRQFKRK